METLTEWIEQQLRERGWKPADLARAAGIPDATLSRILNHQSRAGPAVCNMIANALSESPEKVFRLAGLLPPLAPPVEEENEGMAIFRSLPPDLRAIAMRLLRSLVPGTLRLPASPALRDTGDAVAETRAPYQIESLDQLEQDIQEFLGDFPELSEIIQEAKAHHLSPQSIRALIFNVRIFSQQHDDRESFARLHQQLSDLFARFIAE